MIKQLREKFNSEFSEEKYNDFLFDINSEFSCKVEFRIAESPVFIPAEVRDELIKAGDEIVNNLKSGNIISAARNAIPENLEVPGEDLHPDVLALDFALCKDESGIIHLNLIELQGFPSLFCYQELLSIKYKKHFSIPSGVTNFFSGLEHDTYLNLLRDLIVGDEDPQNVILLEIEPHKQKTYIDFVCTEKWLGVKAVCIKDVFKESKKLHYFNNGKKIPVNRIYNRVIFDELHKRSDIKPGFNFHEAFDVKWIPHPNWFFKISKHTLPSLKSKYVPETFFLHELDEQPSDLTGYVLKPLYSFAGAGVKYDVSKKDIDEIKSSEKHKYILQRKINYEPIIETPDIPAKAEIRLLYLWKEKPVLVNNIVRLSKGKMMGVDFNKDKTWVGSSIAYFES